MDTSSVTFDLPAWISPWLVEHSCQLRAGEERMRAVIELARQNVRRRTGGPFAAAVFDDKGQLIAAGVNYVISGRCSVLHAEIVAIMLAQAALRRYDLSNGGREIYELVTATEPCAMCLGAIPWSGITSLTCGARSEDATVVGFDEGPRHPEWVRELGERGIAVRRDVLRGDAAAVLQEYAKAGGEIYNPPGSRRIDR